MTVHCLRNARLKQALLHSITDRRCNRESATEGPAGYCARRRAFCASARSPGADRPKPIVVATVAQFSVTPVYRFAIALDARGQGRPVAASRVTEDAIAARPDCAPRLHSNLGASTRPIASQVGLRAPPRAARDTLMRPYTVPDYPSQHSPADCTGSSDRLSARRP